MTTESVRSQDTPAILGGTPACDATWPRWPIHDEQEERRLLEVLRSGNWWFGENVRQFEAEFAEFQGARYGVTCTNGTTAIEVALRAVGVVEGNEVIVPPYSFIATASAVVTVGAVPVFADIRPDTLCLDPADVARKIGPRTRAIVPVHVAGRMADMDAINALAAEYGLAVVEDSAHAWGSQLRGRGAGTWGRCGTFSFQVTKNITAGEGGILVTDDEDLADLCRSYTHCGRTKHSNWYDHDLLGSNLRMTEFQAAVLRAQLTRLETQVAQRTAAARLLDEGLMGLRGIRLQPPADQMTRRSYHMYVLRIDEAELGLSRHKLIQALHAENIPASEGWYRPLYRNGVFQRAHEGPPHGIRAPLSTKGVDYRGVACPVCEQVCQDAVWIPQNVLLGTQEQVERLVRGFQRLVTYADQVQARGDETDCTDGR